jgi:hypothetical protein
MCLYILVYLYIRKAKQNISICLYIHINMNIYTCIYICIYIYIHVYYLSSDIVAPLGNLYEFFNNCNELIFAFVLTPVRMFVVKFPVDNR